MSFPSQLSLFPADAHLHLLYLKLSADCFAHEDERAGIRFFILAAAEKRHLFDEVFNRVWEIKGRPEIEADSTRRNFGKHSFYHMGGLDSTYEERSNAVRSVLEQNSNPEEHHELQLRQARVYRCLWNIQGQPAADPSNGEYAFYQMHGHTSTLDQKLSAARMYAEESRAFTWLTNHGEVRLIKRADGKLEFLELDRANQRELSTIFRSSLPIEQLINALLNCDVSTHSAETPADFLSLRPCEEFSPIRRDGRDIILYWKEGSLIARMFNVAKRTFSSVNVSENVRNLQNQIQNMPPQRRESFLSDFRDSYSFQYERIDSFDFVLKTFASEFNGQTILDRDNWAITLIIGGPCSPSNFNSIDFGHAMIAYEGVENGEAFIKCVHLKKRPNSPQDSNRSSNEAEIEFIDNWNVDPNAPKTPTWPRTREKVQAMVTRLQEMAQRPIKMNLTGQNWSSSASLWKLPRLVGAAQHDLQIQLVKGIKSTYFDPLARIFSQQINNSSYNENRFFEMHNPHGFNERNESKPKPFWQYKPQHVNSWERRKSRSIFEVGRYVDVRADIARQLSENPEHNCLTFAIQGAEFASIHLPEPGGLIAAPNAYIRQIANDPNAQRYAHNHS